MSVLSRYYFVFLIFYFVFGAVRTIAKKQGDGSVLAKGQHIITVLLVIFAFFILSFDENFLSFDVSALVFGGFVLIFAIFGSFAVRKVYARACLIITSCAFFLMVLGFVVLQRLDDGLAVRQLVFAAAGLGVSLIIPLIFRFFSNFERLEKLYLLLCFVLVGIVTIADILAALTGLPLVAIDEFGATRWISIAGFSFQASEFAKPIFVVYLACAFRTKPGSGKMVFTGAASAALIGILVIQRDLGSALMFFAVFMMMFYVATGNKILAAAGLGAMSAASVAAYHIFAHLRIRVAAWSNPWPLINDQGFQIAQSLFAIGTWGPFGIGLGRGMANHIPVVERDVIFSAISEEFGWLFALMIIAIYGLMLFRGMSIAKYSKRPLYAMMALGFTVFLTFQAFVAIGGNIKLMPMTGITLPFVSYGGSSIFVSILMVGVLNWLNGQINFDDEEGKEPIFMHIEGDEAL